MSENTNAEFGIFIWSVKLLTYDFCSLCLDNFQVISYFLMGGVLLWFASSLCTLLFQIHPNKKKKNRNLGRHHHRRRPHLFFFGMKENTSLFLGEPRRRQTTTLLLHNQALSLLQVLPTYDRRSVGSQFTQLYYIALAVWLSSSPVFIKVLVI